MTHHQLDKLHLAGHRVIIDHRRTWRLTLMVLSDFASYLPSSWKVDTLVCVWPCKRRLIYANLGEAAIFSIRHRHDWKKQQSSSNQNAVSLADQCNEIRQLTASCRLTPIQVKKKQDFALKPTLFVPINNLPSVPCLRQIAQGHFKLSIPTKCSLDSRRSTGFTRIRWVFAEP